MEIVGVERQRREAAAEIVGARARALQEAQEAQRVADDRLAAVLATLEMARVYEGAVGQAADDPQPDEPTVNEGTAAADAEDHGSLKDALLQSLVPGQPYTLQEIYSRVESVRPGIRRNAIRARLTVMTRQGQAHSPGRGIYVLATPQEEDRSDS